MKQVKSFGCRLGFTLIELLVVIGIIGILIAAVMPMIRGSSDAGLAAKCMSNMHNLAEAALLFANRNGGNHGYYPVAGFYRSVYVGKKGGKYVPIYFPRRSWLSNYGDAGTLNNDNTSVINGDVPHFDDNRRDDQTFAITNGAVWDCVGRSFDAYRCPVHSRTFEKAKGYPPAWSFVMNQAFGFDKDGKGTGGIPGGSIKNTTIDVGKDRFGVDGDDHDYRNPDKVLMFAEVQGADFTEKSSGITMKAIVSGSDIETDGVLQYDKGEVMGFNHTMGKKRHCGHVAFADGHVEKIIMPTKEDNIKKVTEYLCLGKDVVFDGSEYTEAK